MFCMIYLNPLVGDHRGGKGEILVTFRSTQDLTKKEIKTRKYLRL